VQNINNETSLSLSLNDARLLEKLSAFQPAKNLSALWETVNSLTCSSSPASDLIKSHYNPFYYYPTYGQVFYSLLRSGFPAKMFYTFLTSPMHATCHALLLYSIYRQLIF
jgi:hypothetical protein